MLQGIGVTVATGVLVGIVFAIGLSRPPRAAVGPKLTCCRSRCPPTLPSAPSGAAAALRWRHCRRDAAGCGPATSRACARDLDRPRRGIGEVAMPPGLERFDCRNNRLAELALAHRRVRRRGRWRPASATAPERIAVVLGTSTSGILAAEQAYRRRDPASGALPADFDYDAHPRPVLARRDSCAPRSACAARRSVVSTACSSARQDVRRGGGADRRRGVRRRGGRRGRHACAG